MSIWGHPVITLGGTAYDTVSTGHGNYPGSPGFIPGYGYYPGSETGGYPWLDGPRVPFDRRKLAAFPEPGRGFSVPEQRQALQAGTALIIVKLPAEAELWFNDSSTSQGGSYRTFVTPPLSNDHDLAYTIRVRWLIKDAELIRVEQVKVQAGQTTTVNFLTSENWKGRRLELLPHPRTVAK
jgi:uncharacterized protein (TIGR03000 family)